MGLARNGRRLLKFEASVWAMKRANESPDDGPKTAAHISKACLESEPWRSCIDVNFAALDSSLARPVATKTLFPQLSLIAGPLFHEMSAEFVKIVPGEDPSIVHVVEA